MKINREYVRSVEGITKVVLLLLGLGCWGLVYIGQVMSSSNEVPEVNDQAVFCAAVTLPTWILTLVIYPMYAFTETGRLSTRFNAALSVICSLLYVACVAFCASYHWFIWWCAGYNDYEVVDTGECPDAEVLRNGGQNLAVVILGSLLAAGYGFAAVLALCTKQARPDPNGFTAANPTSESKAAESGLL